MRIIALIVIAVCCASLYLAKKNAGLCGIGTYNELPFDMKAFYNNGFWFADEYDFSILSEGVSIETANFGKIMVQDIQSISYNEDIFFARLITDKSLLLYAIVDAENPTWQDVNFFDETEFNFLFRSPIEDWIKIDIDLCNTFLDSPLYENTLLFLLFLIFIWIVYIPLKNKITRVE